MKHQVSELELNDGLKLLLIDVPGAPVFSIEINFRAGEFLLEREKWETAHLMEHLLLGANNKFNTAREFQSEIEKNGAYTNASTSVYDINYEAECADFEWERVLQLFIEAINKPKFLDIEFDAEAGNVKEELIGRSNNHFRHLSIALRESMGLLAVTDTERVELMQNIMLDDISKHYRSTHGRGNMRVIIGGSIYGKKKKILNMFEEALSDKKDITRIDLPSEDVKKLDKSLKIFVKDVPNVYFYLDTYKLGKPTNIENDSLAVLSTILTETLYSRIFGEAREKGLVYGMGSGHSLYQAYAGWWIGAQVGVNNIVALSTLIAKHLKDCANGGITQKEIDEAKQHMLGKHQRSLQTVASLVGAYGSRYFFDDTIVDQNKIPDRINRVTRETVVDALSNQIRSRIYGIGFLGNVNNNEVESANKIFTKLLEG